jgi:hypothetical protein
VNFFGHAAVASWCSTEPSFVLGSMLPDFCGMTRVRVPELIGPLAEGVRFHHRTDAVFHDAPTFVALSRSAREDLGKRGLRRGSALAVAHIGVEIVLDGVLASDPRARQAYLSALALGSTLRNANWRDPAEAARVLELMLALESRGLSRAHAQPGVVALRVERALRGRPRLALASGDEHVVAAWAESARQQISAQSAALVSEIRSGLAREML